MSMGKRNPLTFILDYLKKHGGYNKKYDTLLRGIVDNADKVDNIDLPNKTNVVLTDHNKAVHDALGIDADTVDGIDLPNTIANVLTDHNKAVHDALGIDADTVDGHDAGTSAGNVLVLDTAGQVPLGNLPLLPASQLDFSFAWKLVGSISSSGVSSIEFSNLVGDTDKVYYLIIITANSGTTSPGIFARFNADTTIGHYNWISWYNTNGTVTTLSQSFNSTTGKAGVQIAGTNANGITLHHIIINAAGITLGTATYVQCSSLGYQSVPPRINLLGGAWIKQAEVTSITLFTGNGSAIDWIAYLFKPKW